MSQPKRSESREGAPEPGGRKRQPPPTTPAAETEQLVLTVSAPSGEVLKAERIDPSGQRRELTPEDFAALVEEDEDEDLAAALQEAYVAGVEDALGEEEEEEEEMALRRAILGRAAGRQLLRRGVRMIILRRALARELSRRGSRRAESQW